MRLLIRRVHAVLLVTAVALVGPQIVAPQSAVADLPPVVDPFALDAMPVLLVGTRAAQISSFDRSGGNDDGNRRWAYLEYARDTRTFTVFRSVGPGALLRLWMTGWRNPAELEFLSDGVPTLSAGVLELFGGAHPAFPAAYVGDETVSSGGFYSYRPILYDRELEVRTHSVSRYIQWTYHRYAHAGTPQENTLRMRRFRSSLEAARAEPVRSAEVAPGAEHLLFATESNGGVIQQLRLTIVPGTVVGAESGAAATVLDQLWLTIAADGAAAPQVNVPVAHYFGGVPNGEPVTSLVVSSQTVDRTHTLSSRLPIPFGRRCRISLVNRSDARVAVTGRVTVAGAPQMASYLTTGLTGHLQAGYAAGATEPGRDMRLAQLAGHGRLAGVVLRLSSNDPERRQILEGDERIFVDGEQTPSLHGTGTEDFFNGGWYYRMGTFSQPWHGNPSHVVDVTGDHTTQFRFLVSDPVPFSRSLTFSMEHGPRNDEPGHFAATVFWYGHASPVATDLEVAVTGAPDEDAHTAPLLGTVSPEPVTRAGGSVAAGQGVTLRIQAPEQTSMIVVRRLVDASLGNQRLSVAVNGAAAHDWYTPGFMEEPAFVQTDYLIPGSLLEDGVASVVLVAPEEWNTYGFTALAVRESTEEEQ